MAQVAEQLTGKTTLGASLEAGVEQLSRWQEITFTKYVRLVLPLDGFAFWVRAAAINPSALANAVVPNVIEPNHAATVSASTASSATFSSAPDVLTVKGSLHYATTQEQDREETFSTNRVTFTAGSPVQEFNLIGVNELYLATFENIRFAFSSRGSFYVQSGLWHYGGAAVYADMVTQIVDDPLTFNANALIVSNSLPIWLGFNKYAPQDWAPFGCPFPLYPSFLSPLNFAPPFGTVHIEPASTKSIAIGSTLDSLFNEEQLCEERVIVTIFGATNNAVIDFTQFVQQQSLNNPDLFGITNSPVPRDEKRAQPELRAIAQKKTIEFQVNYYQSRARNLARQLILSAVPSFVIT